MCSRGRGPACAGSSPGCPVGGRDLGVSRLLGHPVRPPIRHPAHLAHVLHDNVQAVVQDHAQESDQVSVLELSGGGGGEDGGTDRWGWRGVRTQLGPRPWDPVPPGHSRHHGRLIQEGLGCHITLDILHGHLLPQVLTLQDGCGGGQSSGPTKTHRPPAGSPA